MRENEIKEFILKNKNSFSEDSIKKQLLNSGYGKSEIERVYSKYNLNSKNKARKGLYLIIVGLFFPILGYLLIIIGIIFAFQQRNKLKDNFSLFVGIFGIFSFFLGIITQMFIFSLLFFGLVSFSFSDLISINPQEKIIFNSNTFYGNLVQSNFNGEEVKILFQSKSLSKLEIIENESKLFTNTSFCNFQKLENLEIDNNNIYLLGHMGEIIFLCNNLENKDFFNGTLSLKYKISDELISSDAEIFLINNP